MSAKRLSPPGPFVALVVLLISAMLLGGSSRSDMASLIVLRPLAALLLGYALWGMEWRQFRAHRIAMVLAAFVLLVPLLQLVPLPPAIWQALPGRELIVEADRAAGLGPVWRPLTLDPAATRNALFSLVVPAAAFFLALRLAGRERGWLLPVLLVLGFASALFGMFQILGPKGSVLYFYRVTHDGSAVGLFANRNHQAAVLSGLFPMLGIYATQRGYHPAFDRWLPWLCLGAGAILVPLILITGSRAGLVVGLIGVIAAAAFFLWFRPRRPHRSHRSHRFQRSRLSLDWRVGVGFATAAALLVWLTVRYGRAEALSRAIEWDAANDFRLQALGPIVEMTKRYWPAGSGQGGFADVFKIDEPYPLLHDTYFNQAHNDWIDVPLAGGAVGVAVLAAIVVAILWRGVQLVRQSKRRDQDYRLAWLGLTLLVIFGLASATDYPLRVPSIACIWVLAVVWLLSGRDKMQPAASSGRTFRIDNSAA